jgi:transcriptional regulator with GAF, ATPase, and Fis domain
VSLRTDDPNSRLRLLYDLGCAFAGRIELDELIPLVMSKVREVLDAEGASVLLLDETRNELYFPYVVSERQEVANRLAGLRLPAERGIAGAALQSGRPIRVDDVRADPRFYPGIDRATGSSTRSIVAAPLIARQGTIGVLQVVNRHGGPFDDADLEFLEALAGAVAVALENAQLYARLKASEEGLRAQVGALRRDLARRAGFADIIGRSPAMMAVFSLMESAAGSPITVLLEGETGTGKELVARAIHRTSARAEGPFLAVNCAALPETLLESELFGHRRGAFTGAIHDQRGLFEAAEGGTVLLDEIGEMPGAMQAKLLRVLQEGEVVPLGDTRPRPIDVRVIAATNRDLRAEVDARQFREDLFYRIAAFPIRLPPLRDRRDDIPLLADCFLASAAQRNGKTIGGIEPEALERLVAYDWPGNVRELQNEIERAVALAPSGERIATAHLSGKLTGCRAAPPPAAGAPAPGVVALRPARAAWEARHVAAVLHLHHGNVSRAARALGISRYMLQRKMKDYDLRGRDDPGGSNGDVSS